MEIRDILLLSLFVFLANGVEALSGFGGVVIAVILGAIFFPIDSFLLPILVPVNFLVVLYIIARHHKKIDYKALFRDIMPFVFIGFLLGFGFKLYIRSKNTQVDWLTLLYGSFIVVFSTYQLIKMIKNRGAEVVTKPMKLPESAFWLGAGGIIYGIYASGGPLITIYANRRLSDKSVFRSTLSALWLLLSGVLIAGDVIGGKINVESVKYSVAVLPALFAGIAAGEALHSRIKESTFRLVVFILLFIAGAGVLFQKFLALYR